MERLKVLYQLGLNGTSPDWLKAMAEVGSLIGLFDVLDYLTAVGMVRAEG